MAKKLKGDLPTFMTGCVTVGGPSTFVVQYSPTDEKREFVLNPGDVVCFFNNGISTINRRSLLSMVSKEEMELRKKSLETSVQRISQEYIEMYESKARESIKFAEKELAEIDDSHVSVLLELAKMSYQSGMEEPYVSEAVQKFKDAIDYAKKAQQHQLAWK